MMSGGGAACFQWLVDDRAGEHALGGFYFCEVEHQPDGWIAFIERVETADEADRFFDPNVEWLPAAESEQMLAVLPVQSLRLERLIDEARVTELLQRENLQSIDVLLFQLLANRRVAQSLLPHLTLLLVFGVGVLCVGTWIN